MATTDNPMPDLDQLVSRHDITGLVEILKRTEDDQVIEQVLGALDRIDDPKVADPLCLRLEHAFTDERRRIAEILGKYRSPQTVRWLIWMLGDPIDAVRIQATRSLGRLKDPESVDALLDKLEDPEPRVRARAAEALAEVGEARAVDRLRASLKDVDPQVRSAVEAAIKRLGGRPDAEPGVTFFDVR